MTKHKTPAPRAQRGETLAEVLIALLIVALSALLLASMVAVAAHINTTARQMDSEFYAALQAVETMDAGTKQPTPAAPATPYNVKIEADAGAPGTPSVREWENVPVDVYTQGDLTLYKKQ